MMARLMLSAGMLTAFAATMAVRRRALASGSPPLRAAIMISLIKRVNALPRLASRAAFLCLIVAHLLCPDIGKPQLVFNFRGYQRGGELGGSSGYQRRSESASLSCGMPLKSRRSESREILKALN